MLRVVEKIFCAFGFCIYFFIIVSCSTMSQNLVKEGKLTFNDVLIDSIEYKTPIVFNRISYYQELTLLMDLLYWRVDANHASYKWFSPSERNEIASCKNGYVVLLYSQDDKKLSKDVIYDEFRKFSFERIFTKDYFKNLKVHPDFTKESLSLYAMEFFCDKNEAREKIIKIPGFESMEFDKR